MRKKFLCIFDGDPYLAISESNTNYYHAIQLDTGLYRQIPSSKISINNACFKLTPNCINSFFSIRDSYLGLTIIESSTQKIYWLQLHPNGKTSNNVIQIELSEVELLKFDFTYYLRI